jgi:hypothetical protein
MKRKSFHFMWLLAVSATLFFAPTSTVKACEGDEKRHKMVITECWAVDENGNPIVIAYSNDCAQGNSHCVYQPCPNE